MFPYSSNFSICLLMISPSLEGYPPDVRQRLTTRCRHHQLPWIPNQQKSSSRHHNLCLHRTYMSLQTHLHPPVGALRHHRTLSMRRVLVILIPALLLVSTMGYTHCNTLEFSLITSEVCNAEVGYLEDKIIGSNSQESEILLSVVLLFGF